MIQCLKAGAMMVVVSVITVSCNPPKKPADPTVDYKAEMMEADRAFSRMSEEKGVKYALMEYIDSKGILLRPNTVPIIGTEAIDYISQASDTSYTMTWEPNGGTVAKSGELGFTYGIYSIKPKKKDTVIYGTYVSIWKKQADGKWKFALETGNEGIE